MEVLCTDPTRICAELGFEGEEGIGLRLDGESLDQVRAVLPRVSWSAARYTISLLRQFEEAQIPVVNRSVSISRVRQKWRCLDFLSKRGFPLPRSVLIRDPKGAADAVARVGGLPCVVKFTQGTQGTGVLLAESVEAVEAMIDTFRGVGRDMIVQEYVASARKTDLRYLIIENRCVAAIRRHAKEGSFRANIHQGGVPEAIEADGEIAALAEKAARASRLDVAGVDILESSRGPMILEINPSPGLEGIEESTKIPLAEMIIDLVQKRWRQPSQ